MNGLKLAFRQIAVLFVVFTLSKVALRSLPGDPLEILSLENPRSVSVESLKKEMGLDLPFHRQIVQDLGRWTDGNLGKSILSNEPISKLLFDQLGATVRLTFLAAVLTLVMASFLGTLASLKSFPFEVPGILKRLAPWANRISEVWGSLSPTLSMVWLGPLLVIAFALEIPIFSVRNSLWLPAFALMFQGVGFWCRAIRDQLILAYQKPMIQSALARGIPTGKVIWKYGWIPSSSALTSYFLNQMGFLMAGAWVTEVVFDRSGMGTLFISSILSRDYPVTESAILVSSALILFFNFLSRLAGDQLGARS
ncbi:MAG: ABC transporter permease [Bdellovibrionales bacterium]|nr:ABC transporter permease [Bdellovibrionales bacterium]